MARDAAGHFTATANAPPGTLYQFEFDDGRVRPDPASRAQPLGVHGPSMVVAAAPPPPAILVRPIAHHVIYELHIGTFTPGGTFDAAIERLHDLKALGVTAVELMPVAQFPGERNWGYDGVCPFAAQWSYGGIDALRRLVHAAHDLGLAVVLDVVYNHLGPEGNYLGEFGPYFTDRYRTPWGKALNFDGPGSDHVREFFIQNALHWTIAEGIDGLRLDAVHAIVDHTARTFLEELVDRVSAVADRAGRRVLLIAESSDNDPRLVRPREVGGVGLDGCWNDDLHHAVRAALTGDTRGYYRAFGEVSQIAKALRERFVFTGQYSSSFRRRHGAPATDVPHGSLIAFTQNHDQVGNRAFGDRLDHAAGADSARVAAALVLLGPFTPMLWMGEEYAERAPFLYFVSHTDAALVEAVRKGRRGEFPELHGECEPPDPQAASTFDRSRLDWSLRERHAPHLHFYAELLRLRRDLDIPALAPSTDAAHAGRAVAILYGCPASLIVAANLGEGAASLTLPSIHQPRSWTMVLDSGSHAWGGRGPECSLRCSEGLLTIILPPVTAAVLRRAMEPE